MKLHAAPLALSLLSALSLGSAFLLAACSAQTGDGGVQGHAALTSNDSDDTDGGAADEDLQYFKDHGFGGIAYAQSCVSKTDGGPDIEGDTLPVGAGRWLECTTALKVSVSTMEVMSTENVPWCLLGAVASYEAQGDSRIVVTVIDAPSDGPWTLKATRDGDAIDLAQIAGPFGSMMWPVWVSATYATTQMQEAGDAASCEALFSGE